MTRVALSRPYMNTKEAAAARTAGRNSLVLMTKHHKGMPTMICAAVMMSFLNHA